MVIGCCGILVGFIGGLVLDVPGGVVGGVIVAVTVEGSRVFTNP